MAQLNVQFNKQMIQDLKAFNTFNSSECYEYVKNFKSGKKLIREHFIIVYDNGGTVFYSTNDKIIRKIKLLTISKDKLGKKLLKVLKDSKLGSYDDVLTMQLSAELSREIDSEIFKSLIKMKK